MEMDSGQLAENMAIREVIELHPFEIRLPITLDLPRWTAFNSAAVVQNDVSDIIAVFQYFDEVAAANSLVYTASARKLRQALNILQRPGSETNIDDIMVCDRLAFEEETDIIPALAESLKKLDALDSLAITSQEPGTRATLEQTRERLFSVATTAVPIFNVWDSMSFIYTLCVESISSDLMAELHLFQFRTIVQILLNHWYTGPVKQSPSTVAAAWSDPGISAPVKIAFATTCSGEADDKVAMQKIRYAFATRLTSGLQIFRKRQQTVCMYYNPGNCPEWLTFIFLWNLPGQYSSICYNNRADKIFKFCEYCEELANYVDSMEIQVKDMWENSQLGEGKAEHVDRRRGHSYRRLMQYTDIQKKFGHVVGTNQGTNP